MSNHPNSKPGTSTSTSIRAITSTLSARSAPSIPSPSQTYEPLVKSILRQRLLYAILLPAFAYAWALANLWSTRSQGGLSRLGLLNSLLNSIAPSTWLHTSALWLFGMLPAIVLRNRYLTAIPTTASSPSKTVHVAMNKRSTHFALMTYLLSALMLAVVHIIMAYVYEPGTGSNPHLSLFVKSKKHPYYLNGRVLFVLSSQVVLALGYLLRTILLDRFTVSWDNALLSTGGGQPKTVRLARFVMTLVTVVLFTALSCATNVLLFVFTRSIVLPLLFYLPLLPQLLRPFTAHFLRGSFTVTLLLRNISLLWRTLLLGMTTAVCWELAKSPLDEPVAVAQSTADPALTLVSGITSADGHFKYLAYAELKQLACDDSSVASARRSALFADQKHNPSMWACIVRDALLVLGRDYQLLLRRGQPEAPAVAVAPPPKTSTPVPATPVRLIRASAIKASPVSPLRAALDTFASDGPISAAVTSTAEAGASHIPELFRSVMHANASAEKAVEVAKKSEERVVGLLEQTKKRWQEGLSAVVWRHLPENAVDVAENVAVWWRRDRTNKTVETCLPNRHLDSLAVSLLCYLICASLEEDRYGVVQRDIPRIIEAILSFLTAVEEYQAEINKLSTPLSPQDLEKLTPQERAEQERLADEIARAGDVFAEISNPLKDGIMQIVRTFGAKLGAFKFPPRIAIKLQGFVDYS